jgi:hypothetical protein
MDHRVVRGPPLGGARRSRRAPEPPYYPRFAHRVPPTRFGQPTTRALMPAEVLDYPLIMANTVWTGITPAANRRKSGP